MSSGPEEVDVVNFGNKWGIMHVTDTKCQPVSHCRRDVTPVALAADVRWSAQNDSEHAQWTRAQAGRWPTPRQVSQIKRSATGQTCNTGRCVWDSNYLQHWGGSPSLRDCDNHKGRIWARWHAFDVSSGRWHRLRPPDHQYQTARRPSSNLFFQIHDVVGWVADGVEALCQESC